MKYYHGSSQKLSIGEILTPRSGYEDDWGHNAFYQALEKYRPSGFIPHREAIFMVGDLDDVDLAGGALDFVYEFMPIGNVEKHDLNWGSEIDSLVSDGHSIDDEEIKTAAENYWNGVPHYNESVWEYLTRVAQVVALVEEN